MPKIKNVFTNGTMDVDSAPEFVKQGDTREVENFRFHTNDGDDGIGNNIKGSLMVSDATEGRDDLKCITCLYNGDLDVFYYYLASTDGLFSKVVEYNPMTDTTVDILKDTLGVLNLDKEGYITGINEIDGLLYWAEWGNNPRRINIERAKTYGTDGFTEDDIKVIVRPPLQKLRITLANAVTPTEQENFIEKKFIYFSYRYRYLDGEYSVLAPFTLCGFEPKKFKYNFVEQSNRSMVNKFNQINIDFWTGNERVTEIQLVFKESENNNVWIIDDFDKSKMGYLHNEIRTFEFFNNKTKRALSKFVLPSFFDNVPLTVKSQELIEGRLLYGYYKENYDIKDSEGQEIEIDYSLELVQLPNTVDREIETIDVNGNPNGTEIIQVPSQIPKRTVKSNRDYEVGMVYGDGDGRITTILVSKTSTIYVPNGASITENSIDAILSKDQKPPAFAKFFRFFIKQPKRGYDQLLPTLFYEDGTYRWIKLEGADKDKVNEGDYLIVKSDTQGYLEALTRVKVLEVTYQEKNFLQPTDVTDRVVERSGLYFKIQPRGFRIDIDDYETYTLSTYDNTRQEYNNPIRNIHQYISQPHFYGDTLNDLSSNSPVTGGSGVYTGNSRKRFYVKIDSAVNPNTFQWSNDGGATTIASGVAITAGVEQTLSDGVKITFASSTGHSIFDEWYINARNSWNTLNSSRAYGFYRTTSEIGELLTLPEDLNKEVITNGARILLRYEEYGRGNSFFEIDHISSDTYDNIQEWFIKEDIMTQISAQCGLTEDDIHFMRGVLYADDNATQITQNDTQGTMTMCIRSVQHGTSVGTKNRVKVSAYTEIVQNSDNNYLIFETEPKEVANEYFEIGKNYRIIDGFHTAQTEGFETDIPNITTDLDQTAIQDLRIKLDWFNAFSYGNAVESYKIQDEFNQKGIDIGERVLTTIKSKYKQVIREADITWSDVYEDEVDFNGLSSFNLSMGNFVKLDKEDGSIQKLHRQNSNLLVLQEDALGIMPYNKQVIYGVEGDKTIGISNNILDKTAYRPYDNGKHGISFNPESFIRDGGRSYMTDQQRGNLLRLANDGITSVNQYNFEHEFSRLMIANKNEKMIAGYDPKHSEYLLYLISEGRCLCFKEGRNGFSQYFNFLDAPDFMLGANNEFYAWNKGKMYRMNATENRNEFFGNQAESKIKYFANAEFSIEKVFHTFGIEGSHPWLVDLKTKLTSREMPKDSFVKLEDYWFSEIMGNTNGEIEKSAVFGLGAFAIVGGEILTNRRPSTMSVGDSIISSTLLFPPNKIIDVLEDRIILQDPIDTDTSFLMYKPNQNIDGASIRGDVMEISMVSDETTKVDLRAINIEISKSDYS